jgi:uncharacterized membrane protein YqhA
MTKVLEKARYLVLIAVVSMLLASIAAFAWGAVKTVQLVVKLFSDVDQAPAVFIELLDKFLIATALLVFAIGLHELFIQEVAEPKWLVFHSFYDLKARLSGLIVLVMAVAFLERFVEWENPLATLYFGIAAAAVSAVLIASNAFWGKE